MADSERKWFTQGGADDTLAQNLNDGDVVLMNRCCASLGMWRSLVCLASKYGVSGDGKGIWDHAAMVVREPSTNVLFLLEGDAGGVTMRSYEERLMQGSDHQEVLLLPLRNGPAADRRREALGGFVKELGLRKTADGFDAAGTHCENTWALYREMHSKPRRGGHYERVDAAAREQRPACRFGAPLIATALQRLGVLDQGVDAASITPRALPTLPLDEQAAFGKPVSVRSM